MTTFTPTLTNSTAATTTSYAQVQAATTSANPRVYLRIQNVDATDSLIVAEGAAASEVAFAKIAPGATLELKIQEIGKDHINLVPQGRIAIKSSANTPTYNATIAKVTETILK